jgi:hypothetical protein
MPRLPRFRPGAFFRGGGQNTNASTDFFGRGKSGVAGSSRVQPARSPLIGAVQNISQSLEPQQESDGINVTRINQIVENKVNRLVPRISERVERQINTFDPNEMLARIFRGGLDELQRFQQNLMSLMQPLQRTFDFIFQSRDILLKLIDQLAVASKNLGSSKSPGMGLGGLKTLALSVAAAYAAKITYDQMQKAEKEGPAPQGGQISGAPPPKGGVQQQQSLTGQLDDMDIALFNSTVEQFANVLEGIRSSISPADDNNTDSGAGTNLKGDSSAQSTSTPMGTAGGAGISLPNAAPEMLALMDAVSAGEGDVNAIQGQIDHGINLEELTIEQAFQAGESMRGKGDTTTGGIGAYQFHPDYHRQTAIDAGLDLNKDKFTKSNQDRMMRSYMTKVYGIQGGKGGEQGMIQSIRDGNLMSDVVPKLAVDMGWPSLPGGSQPNVNTANFQSTYNASFSNYASETGLNPSLDGSELRSESSRTIAQSPEQIITEDDVQTNIIPLNMGNDQQQKPSLRNMPDGEGAKVPFLIPFDMGNIHTMYSRIVYNIVDG